MSGIESQVLEVFLERLQAGDEVSDDVVDALRGYLGEQSLPSAEQLVDLFLRGSGDTLT